MPGPDHGALFEATLESQERLGLLRFLTCGSVDDGKSTLIGRLLHEAGQIFEDQLAGLESASRRHGTTGEAIDFALLLDGLAAEREQGITIDVAYRFFTTDRRKFIVADTPGHEQYTRNMATGASTADLAVLLVDARHGVMVQTRRHAFIASLLGIREVVLAVNKMDLVGWDEARFRCVEAEFRTFAEMVGLPRVTAIPLSALTGDNVAAPGAVAAWFDGPTLLGHLETVDVAHDDPERPARFPVQWVVRPDLDFRGYAGTLTAGRLSRGDRVRVLPSGRESRIARIVTPSGDRDRAVAGEAPVLTLEDQIDVSRGDLIVPADRPAAIADQFLATLVWMNETALLPGRSYEMRIGTASVPATVTTLKHRIDVNTLEERPARELGLNEIAVCNVATDRPIPFDPYVENRDTGGFVLIDRLTLETVGAGMITFALRRATNVTWQAIEVDRAARARLKGHRSAVLWFTGLSGSGKSSVASRVEARLNAAGVHTFLLDGDNVRHGLNRDLGFTDADRVENIRRVAEVARLMTDAGLVVLVSLISPYRSERRMARERMVESEFVEVFVDTPLKICEARDPKGLYRRARAGEIPNFTGVSAPYETPEAPDLHLDGAAHDPDILADTVIDRLRVDGIF